MKIKRFLKCIWIIILALIVISMFIDKTKNIKYSNYLFSIKDQGDELVIKNGIHMVGANIYFSEDKVTIDNYHLNYLILNNARNSFDLQFIYPNGSKSSVRNINMNRAFFLSDKDAGSISFGGAQNTEKSVGSQNTKESEGAQNTEKSLDDQYICMMSLVAHLRIKMLIKDLYTFGIMFLIIFIIGCVFHLNPCLAKKIFVNSKKTEEQLEKTAEIAASFVIIASLMSFFLLL